MIHFCATLTKMYTLLLKLKQRFEMEGTMQLEIIDFINPEDWMSDVTADDVPRLKINTDSDLFITRYKGAERFVAVQFNIIYFQCVFTPPSLHLQL